MKKKKKSRNAQKKAAPVAEVNASGPADSEGNAAEPGKEKQNQKNEQKKEHKGGNKGPKGGNRNGGGRRNDRPKKENI